MTSSAPEPSKKPFSWQLLLSAAGAACGGVGLILGLWAVFGHGAANNAAQPRHGTAVTAQTAGRGAEGRATSSAQPGMGSVAGTSSAAPASGSTAGPPGGASAPTGSPTEIATWKAVAAKYPALAIYAVNEIATSGAPVFVVAASGRVLITDAQADWIVEGGRLYVGSGAQVRDITHELALDAGARTFNALPRADALVNVYGKGTRQMILFADPDCPACQTLERTLEAAGSALDATVYTFPMPLVAVHPEAVDKMAWIECAKDPSAYWRSWMTQSAEGWAKWKAAHPSRDDCEDGAKRIIDSVKAAKMLGFTQTPTLIFPNGQVVPGAVDIDTLNQLLDAPARATGAEGAGLAGGVPASAGTAHAPATAASAAVSAGNGSHTPPSS